MNRQATLPPTGLRWRKSSRSNTGNDPQCVELAHLPQGMAIQDTKHRGQCLAFGSAAWNHFAAHVKTRRLHA